MHAQEEGQAPATAAVYTWRQVCDQSTVLAQPPRLLCCSSGGAAPAATRYDASAACNATRDAQSSAGRHTTAAAACGSHLSRACRHCRVVEVAEAHGQPALVSGEGVEKGNTTAHVSVSQQRQRGYYHVAMQNHSWQSPGDNVSGHTEGNQASAQLRYGTAKTYGCMAKPHMHGRECRHHTYTRSQRTSAWCPGGRMMAAPQGASPLATATATSMAPPAAMAAHSYVAGPR